MLLARVTLQAKINALFLHRYTCRGNTGCTHTNTDRSFKIHEKVPMPKDVYELHWKRLSKMAKKYLWEGRWFNEPWNCLFSTQFLFESHSIGKRNRDPSFKILTGSFSQLCSSCPASCGTTSLTQIFTTVLNVTAQKLLLYLSIMWREDTDLSRLEPTRCTDVSLSGTRRTASGTPCTASAALLKTGWSALFLQILW